MADGSDGPRARRIRRGRLISREEVASPGFVPETLDSSIIAIPLLKKLEEEEKTGGDRPQVYAIVIDANLRHEKGRAAARERIIRLIGAAIRAAGTDGVEQRADRAKSELSDQYVFARLEAKVIRKLVELDTAQVETKPRSRAIHRLWPDFPVKALLTKSISTVKADAARISFSAEGDGILWAVMDSGISNHDHFERSGNLVTSDPIQHRDFTGAAKEAPLEDKFGHGTHVAGIIAGEITAEPPPGSKAKPREIKVLSRFLDKDGKKQYAMEHPAMVSGIARKTKLLSLKVLDDKGDGLASNLIAAVEYIQRLNGYGRNIVVHGVNMSVGYDFDPEWFACGQSPLCVEVDRLVRSGVVVVVAAGNTGYGYQTADKKGAVRSGLDLTINDPGNAALAITVGSTHRDKPHTFGVSYFSSKGPTGDGRLKPDLVAPGEKIRSCAAGKYLEDATKRGFPCDYVEQSGTSMAAPHVSGVIAAFLSVRPEFIGQPEAVKEIFLSTATDLKRDRHFQGHGLVDLMRAIQTV